MGGLSTAEWSERGEQVSLLGHELFVIDSDSGIDSGGDADGGRPTILLLHGFPTASWDWAPVWEVLASSHRLIALDFLGFGFSDKPARHSYSIHEQADLCEALVKERGLDQFHVLAHDYGDTVAQELLARQNAGTGAGHWLSLCLLNGGLFPETHRPRMVQRLLLGPLGPLVGRLMDQDALQRSFKAVFGPATPPSDELCDGFWSLITHKNGQRISHRLIHYMNDRKLHRERWVAALQEARIPLGLINGSVDPVSGAHMVARYRELVSATHFVAELRTIGHYPQVEAPTETLAAYRRFLASAG